MTATVVPTKTLRSMHFMPVEVGKVFVKPLDRVTPGDPVIRLGCSISGMVLRCPFVGVVAHVFVAEGDTVDPGARLVCIDIHASDPTRAYVRSASWRLAEVEIEAMRQERKRLERRKAEEREHRQRQTQESRKAAERRTVEEREHRQRQAQESRKEAERQRSEEEEQQKLDEMLRQRRKAEELRKKGEEEEQQRLDEMLRQRRKAENLRKKREEEELRQRQADTLREHHEFLRANRCCLDCARPLGIFDRFARRTVHPHCRSPVATDA